MNVLLIGSGAREHAIAWKLRQSPRLDDLIIAPGNAGTETLGINVPVPVADLASLADVARRHRVDLTVVGPETPLAAGIVDLFQQDGLKIVGPTKLAARIESSKLFAKGLMREAGIPTAAYEAFSSHAEAVRYVESVSFPRVVKADGLAAGKGVTVCQTREEALGAIHESMVLRAFGAEGESVLVEEMLTGPEISVFAFTDGTNLSPLAAACDYKRASDGDRGPNTGGMGSYSPPPFWDAALSERITAEIMKPAVRALAARGHPFTGVLYGGLILTDDGPKVIEFNCRLGDPETQVVMPRLQSDLLDILLATVEGTVDRCPVEWSDEAYVAVVMTSGGYPGAYLTGYPISGLECLDPGLVTFHAGTRTEAGSDGHGGLVVTDGGRVLTVVASGDSVAAARASVYGGLPLVQFEHAHYRTDIALLAGTNPMGLAPRSAREAEEE